MKAVLLVSHGSVSKNLVKEVETVVKELRKKNIADFIDYAFLEIQSPSIPEGIARCVQKGADSIMILLNFLNSGRHVDKDIPSIIEQARKDYPHVLFKISSPVGQHLKMVDLFCDLLFQMSS